MAHCIARRCGGIGRRAWFRSMSTQVGGGSTPSSGTYRIAAALLTAAISFGRRSRFRRGRFGGGRCRPGQRDPEIGRICVAGVASEQHRHHVAVVALAEVEHLSVDFHAVRIVCRRRDGNRAVGHAVGGKRKDSPDAPREPLMR